jgi:hypothetical protein
MRVFIIFAITLLLPVTAFAQTPCADPQNPVTLEQEGFGTVTARDFSAEDETTTFEGAKLTYMGWTVRAETLSITGQKLKGVNVCLETAGARGTATRITTRDRVVEVETLDLILDPAPAPLPAGTYRLRAPKGELEDGIVRAETAVLDRLNDKLQPVERYRASRLTIQGSKLHADQIEYAGLTFGLRGENGDTTNGNLQAISVSGTLGRNAAASEIEFTARRAFLIDGRTVRLEDVTLRLFGLEIVTLPSLDYPISPSSRGFAPSPLGFNADGSFNQPFRFNLSDGLTIGVENVRLDTVVDTRLSVILHRAFTNGRAALSFGLAARDGDSSFAISQPFDTTDGASSLRFRLGTEPASGPTFGFKLITAGNFGRECQTDCDPFEDIRVGYAQRFELESFAVRPKLEIGQAWQPDLKPDQSKPSSLSQTLGFARLETGVSWASSLGPVGLSFGLNGRVTAFGPGPNLHNGGLGADMAFNFSAGYTFEWLSLGSSLSYSQPFGEAPIRRYNPEGNAYTRVGLTAALAPVIFAPPLGFSGLWLERPRVGLNLEANVREATVDDPLWRSIAFDLGFDLSVYDGVVLNDRFERPFQTPAFTLSPAFRYDFAPNERKGSVGMNFTFYGASLAYTVGAFLDVRKDGSTGIRLNFGVRFR